MKTRVDKYTEDTDNFLPKRVSKNTDLYEQIKKSELEIYDIGSNAKVIGENESQINIDKIKEILEKNYQDSSKKRNLNFEPVEDQELELEKTREYDINAILEQAKEEKEVDYQTERLKKIRDTQYDILRNLEMDSSKPPVRKEEKTKEELLELINTINLNETYGKRKMEMETNSLPELDPLDILSDLKGDENTVVAGAKEFSEEMAKYEMSDVSHDDKEISDAMDEDLDDSFYTNNMTFSKKDFADFDDFEEEKGSVVVKVLIVIVFLAIVAGVVLFLNEFLKLGWF